MTDPPEPFDWEAPAGTEHRPGHLTERPRHGDGGDDHTPDDDDEYVELRPPSSRRRRILTVLFGLVVVGSLFVGALALWVTRQLDPPGDPGEVRSIEIPEGATSDEIGRLLADENVIANDLVWGWYLRINGGGPFEAGVYDLAEHSSIHDVIDVLAEGPRPPEERAFTVPEGLTVPETLRRLASTEDGLGFDESTMQQLLEDGEIVSAVLGPDIPSAEGLLFPETYRVAAEADAKAVLQQMVDQLDTTLTEAHVETAQARFNLSPYEILIVASLIEEETKVPEERPMVAQVIYNRLRQGIPLGIDATSRYEAELAGRSREDIDFTSDSPYNTRRVQGLPPTPIASPGRASIEAALEPADGPWTYYVLESADGHHFFTDSNREFINAKQRCADLGLGCG